MWFTVVIEGVATTMIMVVATTILVVAGAPEVMAVIAATTIKFTACGCDGQSSHVREGPVS
jgi:hypothetical protein